MAQPDYAPVVQEELTQAEKALAFAEKTTITNAVENDTVAAELKRIKDWQRAVETKRQAYVAKPQELIDMMNGDFYKLYKKPAGGAAPGGILGKLESIYKRLLLAWDQAERKRIADEEARLREEARKKEEAERAKLLKRAETAEAKGKEDKADELRQQAAEVSVPAPALAPAQRAVGIQVRKSWDFEITDAAAIPREYLIVNETAIRKVVGALKGETKIPGIRAFEKETVAA